MEIKKTKDYKIFKFSPCNAVIKKEHVERVAASIKIKNMLHMRPILVNKDMEVIDGQHRLKAAQLLGLPIFYQIDDSLQDEDMGLLNSNARVWKVEDYVHHYAQRGKDHYIKFREFLNKTGLRLDLALNIIGQEGGKNKKKKLGRGLFSFPPTG
ncbi:ParB N-terminal domain-containing protein [bacterium]|nr:ParB N-terminal domain-containing protein [bacterium]